MTLQYKEDICTCHGEKRLIVKKILPNKYCQEGNKERLLARKQPRAVGWLTHPAKPLRRVPIKYKPKNTGEYVLYETIWATRPHVSWLSGAELGEELNVMCFSHILSKGAYPGFRLYDKNIILKTPQEHHDWHNILREKLLEKNHDWQKVFDLEQELKEEYHNS